MKFTTKMSVVALGLSMAWQVQAASEIDMLINMLHENGLVTDAQYGRLQDEIKQNQAETEQLRLKVAELEKANQAPKNDVKVSVKGGGLKVASTDGAFAAKLGGRVQADAATYSDEIAQGNGTEIRRARLYLQGKMYTDFGYKIQYDFVDTGSKGIKDAYLSYHGFDNLSLKLGNFKDPFSLQEQTSSKFVTFTERGLPTAFKAGRHIGAMGTTVGNNWTLAAGLFGDTVTSSGGAEDEDWGWGARATWAPIQSKTQLMHVGVGLNYRDTQSANSVRFKTQAETHVSGVSIVDTGTINDVDDVFKWGLEAAYVQGPFSAQSEYIRSEVSRDMSSDITFHGWYAQAGYFFTGESRQYKQGKFGKITPKQSVGEGGIGAWEMALRFSTIDLRDKDIDGGEADSMALGINWFATPTLRFSANYVDILDIEGGSYDDQEPSLFQVRSQWAF